MLQQYQKMMVMKVQIICNEAKIKFHLTASQRNISIAWRMGICPETTNLILNVRVCTSFTILIKYQSNCFFGFPIIDFEHGQVHRQLSVSSDSKLLDDDIREETRVIMRPKKPPRPKSEVFLNKHDLHPRKKRFSAFGVRLD